MIEKRTNRKGVTSYLFKVSCGYIDGKQVTKSKTYHPTATLPKQIEKEVNKEYILFEKQVHTEKAKEREREKHNTTGFSIDTVTFKELLDYWLNLQSSGDKYKPSTITKFKQCKKRIDKSIGNILIKNINYWNIQDFITSLSKNGVNQKTGKGLSKKSQKSYLDLISDVMNFARLHRLVEHNPCIGITFSKSETKEKEPYTSDEVEKILKALKNEALFKKVLFYLFASSGMRKGEVLGLQFRDIDYNKSVLTVNRTLNYQPEYGVYTSTPKTKSSCRTLYIQPKILSLIQELQQEQQKQAQKCGDQWCNYDGFLFTAWNGKPLNPSMPYKWLQKICIKENIPFKALHTFRHTVATQAIHGGANIKDVSDMLGHSQVSTTLNIYAHAIQKDSKDVLNIVANRMNFFAS